MVGQVRQDLVAVHRKSLRQIDWLMPGVVWAMDGTEYDLGVAGKIHLHNTQDFGSRYKLPPLSGECPVGEEIAGYLGDKFFRFGPPLFLKRDNGGNLNHRAVNEVLSEFFVLPLNSPIYYAPYNGAITFMSHESKCLKCGAMLTSDVNDMRGSNIRRAEVRDAETVRYLYQTSFGVWV